MPIPPANYVVSGSITLGIWRKVGGAWAMATSGEVGIYADVGNSPGQNTVGWYYSEAHALGAGVTDFGITIESHDGTAAALNNLDVSYTASSASATRTATPGGEQARATVRP